MIDLVRAAALGTVLFAVYALGACPTIYVGDSGELVTAVHTLGIPHPTGYPLYVLLGKLWTLLVPIGSIAARMSLFSALAGAAACASLFHLCRRAALHPAAALLAATSLAFAPTFWAEANVQRVYTLNALFVVLVTAAAWRWHERRDPRHLIVAFALSGLGATNHVFMAVYAAVLAVVAVSVEPSLLARPRQLIAAAAAFVAGLLPYAYLPLRSRANPALDWGNPESLDAFLAVVTRRDFWDRAWMEGPADALSVATDYLGSFPVELAWAGTSLAVLGVVAGWRRRMPVALLVAVMLANVAALAAHGSRSDIFVWHRYYLPSYALAAVLAGIGCHEVLVWLPRRLRWLPLMVPLVMLANGWSRFDRSRYRLAEDFAVRVLDSLPPGAHLIASDDNVLFALIYLHLVEGRRPDVDLVLQGVGEAALPPLRFDPDTDSLFFTHHPNWNMPGLAIVPVGVTLRAWRAGRPPPPAGARRGTLAGEDDPRVPKDDLTQNLIGHFHYMLGLTSEERAWPEAKRQFAAAAVASPDNDVLFYNLGLVFRRNGLLPESAAAFRRAQAINPRHLASHDRPRAADRLAELAAEATRLDALERTLTRDPLLAATVPGSVEHDRRIAELLEARGEERAARGWRLRALVLEAG
jgi:tetratricopeptide (TPR) repeat protein